MGFSFSWFAVRGVTRDTALEELGLELTGKTDFHVPICGVAQLPDGWLLFAFDEDLDRAFEESFVALSKHGPAVACAVDEHVMFQEARGYEGGAQVWRVTHDSSKPEGMYHLDVEGRPPATFEEIRRTALANQDENGGKDSEVDFVCEAPLELAKSICGFKHDDDPPEEMTPFAGLRRSRAAASGSGGGGGGDGKPGFFARLFGRR